MFKKCEVSTLGSLVPPPATRSTDRGVDVRERLGSFEAGYETVWNKGVNVMERSG
jgi:hypothetical protein